MINFQQKKRIRSSFYTKISLFLLIFIFIFFFQLLGIYNKYKVSKDNLDKIKTDLSSLRNKEEYLKGEIERFESSKGIEEEIREKYGFVKPNEEIIIILNNEDDSSRNHKIKTNWWFKFLSWF
jgi:cell division protein FtsB